MSVARIQDSPTGANTYDTSQVLPFGQGAFQRGQTGAPPVDWGFNLLDPTGFLRTIGAGGNPLSNDPFARFYPPGSRRDAPYDPNNPYSSNENPVDQPGEADAIYAALNEAGLSPADFEVVMSRLENGDDFDTIMQFIGGARTTADAQRSANKISEKADAMSAQGIKDVDAYEAFLKGELAPFLGGKDAVSGYIADPSMGRKLDPNFINSSQGYGTQLSEADTFINAELDRIRTSADNTVASSGLRASGKTGTQLQSSSILAGNKKGEARQRATTDANSRISALLKSLNEDVPSLRRSFQTGDIGALQSAQQAFNSIQRPDYFGTGTGLKFDTTGLDLGQRNIQDAQNLNALLGFAGIAQNAGEQIGQLPGQLKAGFGGN